MLDVRLLKENHMLQKFYIFSLDIANSIIIQGVCHDCNDLLQMSPEDGLNVLETLVS